MAVFERPSKLDRRAQSPWDAAPAGSSPWELALAADNALQNEPWSTDGRITKGSFAAGFARMAAEKDDWAGMPVPLMGERITIEPSYAYADRMNGVNKLTCPEKFLPSHLTTIPDGVTVRNTFWSDRLRSTMYILEENGKFEGGRLPGVNHVMQDLTTLGCADAWSLKTEYRAMETLRGLVSHRQFRQYVLTGSFIESSKRSKVFYLFRRLRPTVALSGATGTMKVLCCLCLHPVAYYQDSWAGAQCPTDDVLAHLMLSRGDEKLYWRRANQHHPLRPEAGL